ncbi:hypothetical protein BC826DRAFT_201917 [Russula brevipes]|nr:hypothetical protein BC826DRAFT_201917 [Russula brevipes]
MFCHFPSETILSLWVSWGWNGRTQAAKDGAVRVWGSLAPWAPLSGSGSEGSIHSHARVPISGTSLLRTNKALKGTPASGCTNHESILTDVLTALSAFRVLAFGPDHPRG